MPDSTDSMPYPRSAFDLTDGIVYFARMVEKIRLRDAGKLRPDYEENLGRGFDGRMCRYLGVRYSTLCERVKQGGDDQVILEWCYAQGIRLSDEQKLVWNKFITKRGLRDEDDGSTQELARYKTASGLGDRNDLETFFDYYEVDERRRP